jgi:hypothetical protein
VSRVATAAAKFFGTSLEYWAKVQEHHTWTHEGRGFFRQKWMIPASTSYLSGATDDHTHGEIVNDVVLV